MPTIALLPPTAGTRTEIAFVPVDTATLAVGPAEAFAPAYDEDDGQVDFDQSDRPHGLGPDGVVVVGTNGADGRYPLLVVTGPGGEHVGYESVFYVPEAEDAARVACPDPLTREQQRAGYALDRSSAAYAAFSDERDAFMRAYCAVFASAWDGFVPTGDPAASDRLHPTVLGEVVLTGRLAAGDAHVGVSCTVDAVPGTYTAVGWTLDPADGMHHAVRVGLYRTGPA